MSTPATPSSPSSRPTGDDRNLVPVEAAAAPTFEDKLELFWKKNRTVIYGICLVVVLAIIGRGAWQYLSRQKERDVQKAYAAATSNEQLKTFAAAHRGHALAAIAELRLADEAFAAGKSAEALAGYDKVIPVLKDGPLATRARIGRAIAQVQTGKRAEAIKDLKQLAEDAKAPKPLRAEAAYHVTSLAVEDRDAAEAQKMVELLNQIDPMGAWSQRAVMLRATLPATAPAPAATPEKKDEPAVQVKLPGAEKK